MQDWQRTNQGFPQQPPAYQGAPRRRRSGSRWLIAVIVVVIALVGLDFGAKAFAQSVIASQMKSRGFPVKPSVSIAGFPFLTQAAARDLRQITITSGAFPAGPVTVTSMNLIVDNVRIDSSFKGGTAGPVRGTVLISLGAIGSFLSAAGPLTQLLGGASGGNGITVTSVGSDEIKASIDLAGGAVSGSAIWKVVASGPGEVKLRLVSSSGLTGGLLSNLDTISIPLNGLPLGLHLTGGLNSNSDGITLNVGAQSISFSN